MRVCLTRHAGVAVLRFEAGEVLDCYVASDVRAQAFRHLEARSDLVLDLSGLEFVDSAGLGVLVGIYKRVNQRGYRVAIAGVKPYVHRVMKVIKLDRVFESFPDVESALAALSGNVDVVGAGRTQR